MNYGEELGYWYLRLNGFFPLRNFVIHRCKRKRIEYRSDLDIVAVRPPHVFEEIGGQLEDWDPYLKGKLDFTRYIGVLCEVKTGRFKKEDLFPEPYLRTGVERLGLVPRTRVDEAVRALEKESGFLGNGARKRICKLLVSPDEHQAASYLNRSIGQVEDFILNRVEKYADEKYASRMFFPSPMFQLLIAQVKRRRHDTSVGGMGG